MFFKLDIFIKSGEIITEVFRVNDDVAKSVGNALTYG